MHFNKWLIAGGVLSAAAALLHVAIIFGGPDWYRFFGAGERMAHAAERGSLRPPAFALGIAALLLIASAYAFSGAGAIGRLPLLRTALATISAIYLARALAPLPILLLWPERINAFVLWSSAVVLAYGLAYAIGTWTAWPSLSRLPA
jgi:hypothetical protein